MYDSLPQKASTYRGRVLLSREIRENLPLGREEASNSLYERDGQFLKYSGFLSV